MRLLSIEEIGITLIVMIIAIFIAGLVWYYAVLTNSQGIITINKGGKNG